MTAGDAERKVFKYIGIALCFAAILVVLGALVLLIRPIPPLRAKRDVLLHNLETIAQDVNAYRSEHGGLPKFLNDVSIPKGPYPEGYRLIVAPNGSFLVVADHLFVDETKEGARCRFACDDKLQVQRLPESSNDKEAWQGTCEEDAQNSKKVSKR